MYRVNNYKLLKIKRLHLLDFVGVLERKKHVLMKIPSQEKRGSDKTQIHSCNTNMLFNLSLCTKYIRTWMHSPNYCLCIGCVNYLQSAAEI